MWFRFQVQIRRQGDVLPSGQGSVAEGQSGHLIARRGTQVREKTRVENSQMGLKFER